jgi:hypothetical protein
MSFFRRKKASSASVPSPSLEDINRTLQRRANEFISTLQQHYPRQFEKLLSEVETGDLARAKLTLRELGSIVDEGYIDPILQELQTQVAASQASTREALEDNPNALSILIRSGNRVEAIELYQKQTGESWQAALDAIKDLERKLKDRS